MRIQRPLGFVALLLAASLLAGCGGSNSTTAAKATSTAPGTLISTPPFRIASLSAADLAAELGGSVSGAQLLQISGTPTCGVDFYYLQYWTQGGAGESATASGALMVPTGGAGCTGARPIVLYGHGTAAQKSYNIANIADPTNPAYGESVLLAAMYAAQGFIVVAPNYAGYDTSTLGYHPFLNAKQQSAEMMDILSAARVALPKTFAASTTDSGKVLVTGYSEGGHVAMATVRAMEAAGQSVTASAPMSGPYALEAFGDAIFAGNVNVGSVEFAPLLTTSYQKAYGNLYAATSDIYTSTYAPGIESLFPGNYSLAAAVQGGLLPQTALFNSTTPSLSDLASAGVPGNLAGELAAVMAVPSNPLFALGFGPSPLLNNAYRISYVLDAASNPDGAVAGSSAAGLAAAPPSLNNLRKALYNNDLRGGAWAPTAPMFLCGGAQDPTVFFKNTQIMAQYWAGFSLPPGLVTAYSVDPYPSTTGSDPLQVGFLQAEAALVAAGGETAFLENYHGGLVPPFCAAAARNFFVHVLGG